MDSEQIELVVDDKPAVAAIARANAAIDGHAAKTRTVTEAAGKQWAGLSDSISRSADRSIGFLDKLMMGFERQSESFRRFGAGAERYLQGLAHITRGTGEFIGASALATKAIVAQTTASGALEVAINRVRIARIAAAGAVEGWGGALFVGSEIAGAVVLEKIARTTYERAQTIQRQAVQAAKSGLDYPTTASLDFAAERIGKPDNFFNSAVKAAGGVDQLAAKLRDLGDVADPVERVRQTFAAFGSDAEKLLPFLDSRFGDNTQRVHEWGLALDENSRTHVDSFRRDVDGLKNSFDGLGSTIHAWSTSVGNYFAQAFGSAWATFRDLPRVAKSLFPPVPRLGLSLTPDPALNPVIQFDARGNLVEQRFKNPFIGVLASDAQQSAGNVASREAVNAMRNVLSPAGSKYFLGARDREGQIKAAVSSLQEKLFVTDRTSEDFGKLVPAAQYPGGYAAQALALQGYVSGHQQLDQIKSDKDAADAAKEAAKAAESLNKSISAVFNNLKLQLLDFGASPVQRLFNQRDRELADLKSQGASGKQLAGVAGEYNQLAMRTAGKQGTDFFQQVVDDIGKNRSRAGAFEGEHFSKQLGENLRASEAAVGADRQIASIRLEAERSGIEREGSRSQRIAALTIDDPYKAAEAGYRIQLDLADKLFSADMRRADLEEDVNKRRVDEVKAYADLEKVAGDARLDRELKILEIQKQQTDSIKRETEGLFHTLFTKPADFGKQLASTLKEATLKPIIDGLSERVASAVHPIVYGKDGQSGIAGTLRGVFGEKKQNPLIASNDANTGATLDNTRAILNWTAIISSLKPQISGTGTGTEAIADLGSTGVSNWLGPIIRNLAPTMALAGALSGAPAMHARGVAFLRQPILHAMQQAMQQSMSQPSGGTSVDSSIKYVGTDTGASSEQFGQPNPARITPAGDPTALSYAQNAALFAPDIAKFAPALVNAGASAVSAIPGLASAAWGTISDGFRAFKDSFKDGSQQGGSGSSSGAGGGAIDTTVRYDADSGNTTERFSSTVGGSGGGGGADGTVDSSESLGGGGGNWLGSILKSAGMGGWGQGQQQGGAGGSGSLSGILGNLKRAGGNLGGLINYKGDGQWNTGGWTGDNASGGSEGQGASGAAEGIGSSSLVTGLAIAGGSKLAMAGISGNRRGTWGGIGEATGGGALIGAGIGMDAGGPLGAAIGAGIGAAAGFTISGLEKLAGVESPITEAKRLVKTQYGLNIDTKLAQQIVDLAKQKYGNHVSIAVRAPEVRQMLELFAAGTGQKMPLSAATPRAGSLQEQNGGLYQTATYTYGNPNTLPSSLPVMGPSGGNYPSPNNAPVMLSLTVGDKGASDFFSGNVLTPDLVQARWGSAQNASNGRLNNSAMLLQPGLVVG